jgi:large repetitive protein
MPPSRIPANLADGMGEVSVVNAVLAAPRAAPDGAAAASSYLRRATRPLGCTAVVLLVLSAVALCLPTTSRARTLEIPSALPSKPDLLTEDDSGAFGSDNYTSNARPRFRVFAAPGLLVEVLEADVVLGSAVVDRRRFADVQIDHEVADGKHEIVARIHVSELSSLSSEVLEVTIDTIPPAVPILDLPSADDSGVSSADNETNLGEWHIYGALDDAFSVPTRELSPMGRNVIYAATPAWSFLPDDGGTLKDGGTGLDGLQGAWSYQARGVDRAGNSSDWSEWLRIVFDSVAPAAPSEPDLLAADDSGAFKDDNVTNIARPRFDVTLDDGALLTLFAGDKRIDGASDIADGEHLISAQAGDLAGNVSPRSPSLSVIVDTARPEGTIQINGGAEGVRDPDVVVGLRFTDVRGPYQLRSSLDHGTTSSAWHPYTEAVAVTLPGGDGTKSVFAEVQDVAGNVGSGSDDILLDRTGPTIRITSPLQHALDVSNVVQFEYTPTDVSGVAVSDANLDANAIANDSSIDAGLLLAGAHRIVITATDTLGNVSTETIAFTVRATISGVIYRVEEGLARGLIDTNTRTPLLAKLEAAQSSIERGARAAAKGQLGAFCNQLRAHSGKNVDAALAARLANWAQDLSASL